MVSVLEQPFLGKFVNHATRNYQNIFENYVDLSSAEKTEEGCAVLTASGPSLIKDLTLIPKSAKIISAQSHVCLLEEKGLRADYMNIVDASEATFDQLTGKWDKENTIPVITPQIHPKTVDYLERGYVYREINPATLFCTWILPSMYPFIKAELLMGGCSGNVNYSLAHLLGFDEVYLAGYNYGSPVGGQTRYNYTFEGNPTPPQEIPDNWRQSEVDGWMTTPTMVRYKTSLYAIIELLKTPVYRLSRTGILDEIPLVGEEFDMKPISDWLTEQKAPRLKYQTNGA